MVTSITFKTEVQMPGRMIKIIANGVSRALYWIARQLLLAPPDAAKSSTTLLAASISSSATISL